MSPTAEFTGAQSELMYPTPLSQWSRVHEPTVQYDSTVLSYCTVRYHTTNIIESGVSTEQGTRNGIFQCRGHDRLFS